MCYKDKTWCVHSLQSQGIARCLVIDCPLDRYVSDKESADYAAWLESTGGHGWMAMADFSSECESYSSLLKDEYK